MDLKFKQGLLDFDAMNDHNKNTLKELEQLLFLLKKYKDMPILQGEIKAIIPKLDTLVKNMK